MRRGLYVAAAGLVFVCLFGSTLTPVVLAATTDVTQVISGTANCSVDETHSGLVPQLSVQPESCQPHIDPTSPPVSGSAAGALAETSPVQAAGTGTDTSALPAAGTAAAQPLPVRSIGTDAPGNQGLLENTIVEPLASWVGIGNPQASVTNPVIATTAVGTTTGLAIDAAFFQFATTKRVFRSGKRRAKTVGSVTRGLFRS